MEMAMVLDESNLLNVCHNAMKPFSTNHTRVINKMADESASD